MGIYSNNSGRNSQTGRRRRTTSGRRPVNRSRFPAFSGIPGAQWYDYLMTPLLILAAVLVVLHIQQVLAFFFFLTIRLMEVSLVFLFFLAILLFLWFVLRRPRRRW